MKKRLTSVGIVLFLAYGCATSSTPPPVVPQVMHGTASWYGQEFAGRTTANGEIFDPLLLTAAHRSLPFGTVVDVRNSTTGQTVRVRINDRGPYVGDRMIDLSYAAAQQIGLIDPGKGDVDVTVVKMGGGEREPPAPYAVTIAEAAAPLPVVAAPAPAPAPPPVPVPPQIEARPAENDFSVQVVEERHGVETRRQVSPDGRTVEVVPVLPAGTAAPAPAPVVSAPGHSAAAKLDEAEQEKRRAAAATTPMAPAIRKFFVQVGAFAVEANAKSLQDRLTRIGQQSSVDHTELYRVRIGPFATREQAIKARESLEASGISAIIVAD